MDQAAILEHFLIYFSSSFDFLTIAFCSTILTFVPIMTIPEVLTLIFEFDLYFYLDFPSLKRKATRVPIPSPHHVQVVVSN